jgi:oligopeptide/dipeptide ABC transporter ATP-binding protein
VLSPVSTRWTEDEYVSQPLLKIVDLEKYFPVRGGFFHRVKAWVKAVDGVSFELQRKRTLGLVGESGCGKSTLGRAVLRLTEPTGGDVILNGESLIGLSKDALKAKRREMQIIYQDPYASLSPRRLVGDTIREPLDVHGIGTPAERRAKVDELLDIVGLRKQALSRYPHEFSGGQRQRIGIARALALNPSFIVADEPVSALDAPVQAQIVNLLVDLQEQMGLAYLLIAHDLHLVRRVCDRVAVMYCGRIMETSDCQSLFSHARHPYSAGLLSCIPRIAATHPGPINAIPGQIPTASDLPSGCHFAPRCVRAEAKCRSEAPTLDYENGRATACFRPL